MIGLKRFKFSSNPFFTLNLKDKEGAVRVRDVEAIVQNRMKIVSRANGSRQLVEVEDGGELESSQI